MSPVGNSSSNGATGSSQNSSSSPTTTAPVNETMFLQLLVAQLQNQDPMNPTDSTTFVTQLAQFQQLEQSMNTGQNVSSILQDLNTITAAYTSPGQTSSTSQS